MLPTCSALNPDTRLTQGALDHHARAHGGELSRSASRAAVSCSRTAHSTTPPGDRSPRRSERSVTSRGSVVASNAPRLAGPVPRTLGRERAGRCRERSVHAHAPTRAGRGRAVRRGVLDVHGGSRPLLPVRTSRLDDVVRALGQCPPREGRLSGRYRSARLNYAFHYGMYRFYRKHYAADRRIGSEPRRLCSDRREARRVDRPERRSPSTCSCRETTSSRHPDGGAAERELAAPATATREQPRFDVGAEREEPVSALVVTWNNEAHHRRLRRRSPRWASGGERDPHVRQSLPRRIGADRPGSGSRVHEARRRTSASPRA